jgi:hypothetical protein
VFDYDFENVPRAIAFFDYLREMFVPLTKLQDARFFYELQTDYEITFFPLKKSLSITSSNPELENLFDQPISSNLRQYLESLNR